MAAAPLLRSFFRVMRCALLVGVVGLLLSPVARAQTPPPGQGWVADSTELRVLRQLYAYTGGAQWTNHTNWLSGASLTDAANWYGVQVRNGDVVNLALGRNGLLGQLPPDLGALARLEYLDLTGNQLLGVLPASLGQCAQLQWLYLSYNRFAGPLPPAWGTLAQLHHLYADDNRLEGPLPAEWDGLTGLWTLNLSGNQLSGDLPATLPPGVSELNLAGNRLSGPLQPLTNLVNLSYLSVAGNRFSGALPQGMGGLSGLTYAYFDGNALSGPLPDNLGRLTKLTHLTAGGNHLSGHIWGNLLLLPNLRLLRLDDNEFTDVQGLNQAGAGLPAGVSLAGNRLDYGGLERLLQAPGQPRFAGGLDLGRQRPPTADDTLFYQAEGPLDLRVPAARGNYLAGYQWQRLVGGQWVNMPGDTLETKSWTRATAAEQGTYRRLVFDHWFRATDPTALASATVYADLTPYAPPARNRPNEANQGVPLAPVAAGVAPPRGGRVNYVRTWTPRVALTDSARVRRAGVDSVATATRYLDGLGRPLQEVQRQATPQRRDLVQVHVYDALGREPKQYLPFPDDTAQTGQGYHYRALVDQPWFYGRTGPASGGLGPLTARDPAWGVARTGVAFAETQFEASPLNRVLAQGAAGEAWQLTNGHIVERAERANTALDSVPRFVPGYGAGVAPGYVGYYAAGELWGTVVADVHGPNEPGASGYVTIEWKDRLGRLVLRQVEANRAKVGSPLVARSRWVRTAYAYDDFGRPRYTVQPEGMRRLLALGDTSAVLPAAVAPFVFHYRYDERGRVIAKQVPGTDGETVVVYDQLDRPILTQDAAQRQRREWTVSKYDVLGRVVLTGLVSTADTVSQGRLQALAAADTAVAQQYEVRVAAGSGQNQVGGYSFERSFPRLGQQGFVRGQALSVTHYDDYDFDNDGQPDVSYDASLDSQFPAGQAPTVDVRTRGLVTGTQTRVLGVAENDPSQAAWLTTTTFYDAQARPVQVQSTNARRGTDLLTSQLDFAGQVVQTANQHTGPHHAPLLVREFFRYDHAGRLLSTRQQLPGEARPALLDSIQYNELGQVLRKTMGTGQLRQDVDYAYNIRGWLTSLNNPFATGGPDLFNLSLHYEKGFTLGYGQYNGNLTGQTWRGRDGMQRAYGYVYDPLNRLLQGDYVARTPGTAAGTNDWRGEADRYRLSFASYDDNGNILTLRRRGLLAGATHVTPARFGQVDALTYAYQGNRLLAVEDAVSTNELPRAAGYHGAPTSLAGDFQEQGVHQGQEYFYDANGNTTQDRNKGITSIAYNYLNLPRQIRFGAGADSVVFHYAASGQKVAKLVYQSGQPLQRTDYLGLYQYEQDSLRFFPHAEGRVLRVVAYDGARQPTVGYAREFSFKDHLGNLRLAYRLGQRQTYTAGLEPAAHERESQQFDSLSVSYPIAVPTSQAHTGTYAARLNAGGTAPQPLGPLKQLAVQQGDTVTVSALGLYPQAVRNNFWFSLASFVTNLLHPAAGSSGGLELRRGRPGLPLLQVGVATGLPLLTQLSNGVPKGYLRVLVFDRDSALVSQVTEQLQATALNRYDSLRIRVVLPQDGYVSAYVGNESDVDVYFDDIQVVHGQGLQVQESEYDPTGLELAGMTGTTPELKRLSQYKFNGKEFQTDLGLNWNHQDWRFFDTQLARWHVTDPEIENGQESWTPYSFGFDNALRFADANGRAPGDGTERAKQYFSNVGAGFIGAAKEAGSYLANHLNPIANAQEAANQTQAFLSNPLGVANRVTHDIMYAGQALTSDNPSTAGNAMGGLLFQAVVVVATEKVMKGLSPCGCFTAGTGVSTRLGRKLIEQVQVGDSVWAYNERTRQTALRPVTHLFRYERDTVYVLHTAIGEALRTTSDHPFYVRGQWVRVRHLSVGDSLVSQSGQRHVLRRIELKFEHVTVYNFTVDELHTYFVGQSRILVHNCPDVPGGASRVRKPDALSPGKFAGESIPATRGAARNFTAAEREAINKIGKDTGCHTCGTKDPGTKSGNFILDHQPPNALNPDDNPQRLYPHCNGCSHAQAGQIRANQIRKPR